MTGLDIDKFIVPLLRTGRQARQEEIGNLVRKSLTKQRESARLLDQANTCVKQLNKEAVQQA